MSKSWRRIRLGEALEVVHGYAFPSEGMSEVLTGKPIIVSIGNFDYQGGFRFNSTRVREFNGDYPKQFNLSPGDLLVAMTCQTPGGEILGLPGLVPDDGRTYLHNQRIGKVITDPALLNVRFAYYCFLRHDVNRQLVATASGTKILHTAPSRIGAVEIDLPSLEEQEAMAAVLAAFDDKIAISEKIAAVSSELISLTFQNSLARSEMATIPLPEAVAFDFGLPFASDNFNTQQKGLPLLRIRDIKSFSPQVWTTERIARDVVVSPGDVVAGMDAEFRPSFWLGAPALLNQRVLRGRPLVEGGGRSFVREVLRKPLGEIEGYKTGTTVIHLNKRDLDLSSVEIPAPDALAAFEKISEPLRGRIIIAAEESRALAGLRDTLLPKLMFGEIRVRDAEKVVEEVT